MSDNPQADVWEPDDFEDFDDVLYEDEGDDFADEGDTDLPTARQLEEAGYDFDDF